MIRFFSIFCFLSLTILVSAQQKESNGKPIRSLVILFETDHFDLTTQNQTDLGNLVDSLKFSDNYMFEISGHTDNVGKKKENDDLSFYRANAVSQYLAKKGVKPAMIQIKSFGSRQPIASNKTDEGKQKNRRAQLLVYKKGEAMDLTNTNQTVTKASLAKTRIEGRVSSKKLGPLSRVKVDFQGATTKESVITNKQGQFSVSLPMNEKFHVHTSYDKHFDYTNEVTINVGSKPIEIELVPLEEHQSMSLRNLNFNANRAVILERSLPSLEILLKQLKEEPNLCFEIGGHVNAPLLDQNTDDQYTNDLSLARALSIYDYLVANGISASRMTPKGYGHSKMIVAKAKTVEEHLANMRVELMVLDCETVKEMKSSENKSHFDRIRKSEFFK